MKAVSEYIIGNTAVRIVDTGHRIRVIDVEREQERRSFFKTAIAIFFAAVLSLSSSLIVVNFHSTHTMMDKQVFRLKSEIETLERENKVLEKKLQDAEPSYQKIYKKALAMGMDFPSNDNVKSYTYKKGSAIRLYAAP